MLSTKRKKKFGVVREASKEIYNAYILALPPEERDRKKEKKRKRRGERRVRN